MLASADTRSSPSTAIEKPVQAGFAGPKITLLDAFRVFKLQQPGKRDQPFAEDRHIKHPVLEQQLIRLQLALQFPH